MRRAFLVLTAALSTMCSVPSRSVGTGPAPPPSSSSPSATSDGDAAPPSLAMGAPKKAIPACTLPASAKASVLASAKPITFSDPHCTGKDPFCNTVDRSPEPKNACYVANDNLRRAERESRGAPAERPKTSGAWDKSTAPKFYDRVDAHLHLDARESQALHRNGFVVADRHAYASYAVAFHDVFQQQLPVYVGVDAILNAVFQANQMLLEEIEQKQLGPRLVRMLDRMRGALKTAGYGAETTEDLAIYLGVAHGLLHGGASPGADASTTELLEQAESASEMAEVGVFGRPRVIDFTQLAPRGHYTGDLMHAIHVKADDPGIGLDRYFKAMMWLSRVEWNLVSRSCRSSQPGETPNRDETPREARDALALADLVRRAGALEDLKAFEQVYSVFGGRREDVTVPDLLGFGIAPTRPDAPEKLRAAIGDRWKRTARIHFMPQGAKELPAIATLFGPRIVPDIAPLTRLVHDRLPERYVLGAADLASVLGHDRAKTYLAADRAKFAGLDDALERSRTELAEGTKRGDVYATWLRAITKVAETPAGALPSYAKTDAFADFRMNSALAGYAQLRHTFVLMAGQGYDAYGCEIPDGWVEPQVGVYEALLAWSRSSRAAVPQRAAYFQRFDAVMEMLLAIAKTELSGQALSEPQRRWLGMISEYVPLGGNGGDSGEPPKYTGWYFDLFPDRHLGAERGVDVVADYFTLTNANAVKYVGVEKATLGVFVVDVGGEPRAMVGPVASAFATTTSIERRLDDEAARKHADGAARERPWAASYVVPEAAAPKLRARVETCGDDVRVVVEGPASSRVGAVSVALLDHHGDAITARASATVGERPGVFVFEGIDGLKVEGVHVRVDDGKRVWDSPFMAGVYRGVDERRRALEGPGFSTMPERD